MSNTKQYPKFIVSEWDREQWGLFILSPYQISISPFLENSPYSLLWPVLDVPRKTLQELCNTLNKIWKQEGQCDNWISVIDKLPERQSRVLVAIAEETNSGIHRFVSVGTFYPNGRTFQVSGEYPTVTHWQPFPELPECTCFLRAITTGHEWKYCPKCGREL